MKSGDREFNPRRNDEAALDVVTYPSTPSIHLRDSFPEYTGLHPVNKLSTCLRQTVVNVVLSSKLVIL